jgi:Phage integrase, N-terminal SAM-like domain
LSPARPDRATFRSLSLRGRFPLSLLTMSNTTTPFGYRVPTAPSVSWLRQRMIEDMTVRNFAPNTLQSYVQQVSLFARHFGRSPEKLGPEEIRAYQIYLADEKKASVGTRTVAVSALRFLYAVTLKRDWTVQLIPAPKKDHHLPVIRVHSPLLAPRVAIRVRQDSTLRIPGQPQSRCPAQSLPSAPERTATYQSSRQASDG